MRETSTFALYTYDMSWDLFQGLSVEHKIEVEQSWSLQNKSLRNVQSFTFALLTSNHNIPHLYGDKSLACLLHTGFECIALQDIHFCSFDLSYSLSASHKV